MPSEGVANRVAAVIVRNGATPAIQTAGRPWHETN
jgi:hypothetical protein